MNRFWDMVAGIGILIGIFLVLTRSKETALIINTISSNAIQGIKTLQGR